MPENGTLASPAGTWQWARMANPTSSFAGGAPIALAVIAGTLIGFFSGETTIGFLAGLATGIAVAILIWMRGR
jgi:hypothetical protein